jgi:chromosome segregation ATPase
MTNSTDDARKTLAKFEARLDAARSALAQNEEKRNELAYAVETGDADARKATEALAIAATKHAADIRSLQAAVAEGGRRVSAAEDGRQREAARVKAQEARIVLTRLADVGAALDSALRSAVVAYASLQSDLRQLGELGAPAPSGALVQVNLKIALDSALGGAGAAPVAPLSRRSFADLCVGWSAPGIAWASEILDAPEKAIKAA